MIIIICIIIFIIIVIIIIVGGAPALGHDREAQLGHREAAAAVDASAVDSPYSRV